MRNKPLCLFILGLVFLCGCHPQRDNFAKDFSLPRYPDFEQSLQLSAHYQDHPVLLIFWATWCPSCVEEIPILNEWHSTYALSGRLDILAVNVQESREHVQSFLSEHPANYSVLLDEDGSVTEQYGLSGLPVVLLLAKGGKIIYYGFSLPSHLEELLAAS